MIYGQIVIQRDQTIVEPFRKTFIVVGELDCLQLLIRLSRFPQRLLFWVTGPLMEAAQPLTQALP